MLISTTPTPGPLTFDTDLEPIEVSGPVPAGVTDATVTFTTTMPGFVLDRGQATVADGRWSFEGRAMTLPAGVLPSVNLTSANGITSPGIPLQLR